MFQLARRLDGVSESATLKLNALVGQMKAQGVDVVNFSAGEPDFGVPEECKAAVRAALDANKSKYTPTPGIPELRELIAAKTNAQQPSVAKAQPWKPADVIVSNGGKQALFNCCLAMINPGDEVLIPAPFWLSYPEMVKIAGGRPKFIHAPFSQGYKITPAQLKEALAPGHQVKFVFLNSPSNPTGSMYTRAEQAALADVLLTTPGAENVWVVSDEIYDRIVFNDDGKHEFCSFVEAAPKMRDRTVTVNGMSKSVAMTGWRIGWTVAPASVTQGINTLQGQSTSGICSLSQSASVAGLRLGESYFGENLAIYRRRRDLLLEILRKSAKIDVFTPQGAFYAFVGVGRCLRAGEDSMGFAERLLQEAKVAVVPGTPFGAPEAVRLSFATDDRSLREGAERMVRYVEGR